MRFEGVIEAGKIEAVFESDFSNDDSDLVILGHTNVGGSEVSSDRHWALLLPAGDVP